MENTFRTLTHSLHKNRTGILIMVFSAALSAFGQYFWKLSDAHSLLPMFIGFVLYGVGAVLMIVAFQFGSFSVLHPMQSLSYVFALLIGFFLLGESIGPTKIMGLVLVMLGVVMIGAGDE